MFDPAAFTSFAYRGYDFDGSVASFHFELIGETTESFTETVTFETTDSTPPDTTRLHRVLALLGGVLGLSYFKAAAPATVLVADGLLSAPALDYLRTTLREGLAEFAYRNELPGFLSPVFVGESAAAIDVIEVTGTPLVPIGGGKDSVVSVESLATVGEVVQFAVNPNVIIRRVAEVSGHPLVSATRKIDRRLLELNAEGALNGHVPVTAMNSLIAVAQSLILGLGPVVMSNESSASDPTLFWNGEPVNHQWSKSLEAERLLARVLEEHAGLSNAYFSLLRPFSELRIARGFASTSKYDQAIVSCNRAFRMGAANVGWCGDCDKCRFVFLAMAPYMSAERLTAIFGKNMFDDATQLPGYRALLGLENHKPFECVGEEAECSVAMSLAARMDDWAESAVVVALTKEIPNLSAGSPALEAQVFAESDASIPASFEKAAHALV